MIGSIRLLRYGDNLEEQGPRVIAPYHFAITSLIEHIREQLAQEADVRPLGNETGKAINNKMKELAKLFEEALNVKVHVFLKPLIMPEEILTQYRTLCEEVPKMGDILRWADVSVQVLADRLYDKIASAQVLVWEAREEIREFRAHFPTEFSPALTCNSKLHIVKLTMDVLDCDVFSDVQEAHNSPGTAIHRIYPNWYEKLMDGGKVGLVLAKVGLKLHPDKVRCYLAATLLPRYPRYLATSLPRYLATSQLICRMDLNKYMYGRYTDFAAEMRPLMTRYFNSVFSEIQDHLKLQLANASMA